jgi:phosphate transport system permease protein
MSSLEKFRKKTERLNRIAAAIISSGGYGVILVIVAILLFLLYQILPLSFQVSVKSVFDIRLESGKTTFKIAGLDQYQEIFYVVDQSGFVDFYSFSDSSRVGRDSLSLLPGEKILCASKGMLTRDIFAAGTNFGRIITGEVIMSPDYSSGTRKITPSFSLRDTMRVEQPADSVPTHIEDLVYRRNDDGIEAWVWRNHAGRIKLKIRDEDGEMYDTDLSSELTDEILTKLTIDYNNEKLMVASVNMEVFWFDISDPSHIYIKDSWKASDARITAMNFLIGSNALIVGDADGKVREMFPVTFMDNRQKFTTIHEFDGHKAPVSMIRVSPRNRSFLTIDIEGGINLSYSTTGATNAVFSFSDHHVVAAEFAPKSDGLLLIDDRNNIGHYAMKDEHPEATLHTLFGKVWYEGYPQPEFVWQSTGGSDEFEPKLSLIPLIFGTLKGTLYAMLFSVPIALLAAIYVSQFSPQWLSRIVKPTVEIMAALPSVVVGFLAGLYFSPLFEKHLISIFLYLALLPALIAAAIIIWRLVPEAVRIRAPMGWELLFVIPLLLAGVWLVSAFSRPVELNLFSGNLTQWLYDTLQIRYDQRNSMVVGFALGFAVVPTLFTISEDALSNVPESLTSAALALGASRWQTVKMIVIPAAAGGIFAAAMLGLGRAIGETMIVLMATGNTPIMDLSPFNGFRAMSACIAVEIPEAPVGGTLYRILFLTAFLLFIFTFIINSLAAIIGDRLRKKYARF